MHLTYNNFKRCKTKPNTPAIDMESLIKKKLLHIANENIYRRVPRNVEQFKADAY